MKRYEQFPHTADIGIIVRSIGRELLAEDMPDAYKDVNQVVNVVHGRSALSKDK
jgi:tRNA-splicing ligase RtcB